jgi:hypothetical protein
MMNRFSKIMPNKAAPADASKPARLSGNVNKEKDMRYLIIFFCSICCILANAYPARSESPEFALTFRSDADKTFQLSLIGSFPSSTKITLLGKSDSDICVTKTLESFTYLHEGGDIENIPATHVDFKVCKQTKGCVLAYFGKDVTEYRIVQLDQNTSESTINDIDSIIRKKEILEKDDEIFLEALSKKPILYVPISKSKNVYIIQYLYKFENDPSKKYGPLFFSADGKITKIDSEAEITRAFILNGRNFFLFHHSCWEGCGEVCTKLLEINKNNFMTNFVDCTWSD